MRTTGNRNCPWVSVSLFRTRFMARAIISLGPGIHLCYWLFAFQVYYGLPHFKVRAAWWERGVRESALLPYGHYSVSRVWKTTSKLLFWFDFLRKRHGRNNPFFTYNIHDIVLYLLTVFHLIMTSRSVAIRVYLSVLFIFLYYVWAERSSTNFDVNHLGFLMNHSILTLQFDRSRCPLYTS